MRLPKELTTHTKTAKYLALAVFIVLPFIAFFVGIDYEQWMEASLPARVVSNTVDTQLTDQSATLTLAGLHLLLYSPFLPTASFTVSSPSDLHQGASSLTYQPYNEIYIGVIPLDKVTTLGKVGEMQPTNFASYVVDLRTFRQQQAGSIQTGPTITMFGKKIITWVTTPKLDVNGKGSQQVMIVEGVTESGNNIWTIRITTTEHINDRDFLSSLSRVQLVEKTSDQNCPKVISCSRGLGCMSTPMCPTLSSL